MPITAEERKCRACHHHWLADELFDRPIQGGKGICGACANKFCLEVATLILNPKSNSLQRKSFQRDLTRIVEKYKYGKSQNKVG